MSLLATALVRVDGRVVRVARAGSGADPFVLLHGYPDNLQLWSAVAPLLLAQRPVIAFDWPGMGDSEAWPGGATPQASADRLARLMDAWGADRAHVVGADMGGQPALAFAAMHPARVATLTVTGSLVISDERTSWEIRVLRRFGWNRALLRHAPRLVFERAVRTSLPRGLPADVRADFWQRFRRREVREYVIRACAGYQGTLPRLPELYARITCPVLLAWGADDRHFPVAHARRLASIVSTARVEVVEGGAHWLPLQAPEDLASRILRFADGYRP